MKKNATLAIGLLCATMLFPQLTHAYSILFGPSLFSPRSNNVDFFQDATILYVKPGSADRYFSAPVFLPNGATVTNIVFFFKDNSPAHIRFQMQRLHIFSNKTHLMCSYSTQGSSFDWQRRNITKISFRDINNNGFLYFISAWFSEGQEQELALRAVKIHYDVII
ncbi:MAG: hypothetical protein JSV17_01260 [Candidatus Aminicenantes bacterium]|nr:MAG: hypothetical protein JSV17_01260 [Candidatus Aminicenantes bacterium]